MMNAEAIAQEVDLYAEGAWVHEDRFPVDILPSLPFIPLKYLQLKGDLLDPLVPFEGSQENVLQGAWAALSVPQVQDSFLHGLRQQNTFDFESGWQSRAAELLVPYLNKDLIAKSLNRDFGYAVSQSGIVMGEVVLKMAKFPDVLMSSGAKMNAFTYWAESLDPSAYEYHSISVVNILKDMIEEVERRSLPSRETFAQAVLERARILTYNAEFVKDTPRHMWYLQCIEKALEFGANPQENEHSDVFLVELLNQQKDVKNTDSLVRILSKWGASEADTVRGANLIAQHMFAFQGNHLYSETYNSSFFKELRVIGNIPGFAPDTGTIDQIAAWAVLAHEESRDLFVKVLPSLQPILSHLSLRTYNDIKGGFSIQKESLVFDRILATVMDKAWLTQILPDENSVWLDMLERHNGEAELMTALYKAQVVFDEAFIDRLLAAGHGDWIVKAGLQNEYYYNAILTNEYRAFSELVIAAQDAMFGATGEKLPEMVVTLLQYKTENPLMSKYVGEAIPNFISQYIIRDDVSPALKDQLDGYLVAVPIEAAVLEKALEHRGSATLREALRLYMLDVIRRDAIDEVVEAYHKGFFGDGINAHSLELQYALNIPLAYKSKEHVKKIEAIITSWFQQLPVTMSNSDDEIRRICKPFVFDVLKKLMDDPHWQDEIMSRYALRSHTSKKLLYRLISLSK